MKIARCHLFNIDGVTAEAHSAVCAIFSHLNYKPDTSAVKYARFKMSIILSVKINET